MDAASRASFESSARRDLCEAAAAPGPSRGVLPPAAVAAVNAPTAPCLAPGAADDITPRRCCSSLDAFRLTSAATPMNTSRHRITAIATPAPAPADSAAGAGTAAPPITAPTPAVPLEADTEADAVTAAAAVRVAEGVPGLEGDGCSDCDGVCVNGSEAGTVPDRDSEEEGEGVVVPDGVTVLDNETLCEEEPERDVDAVGTLV